MRRIIIKNLTDIKLEHIFECGQCFRWESQDCPDMTGAERYAGVAGSYAAVVTLCSEECASANGELITPVKEKKSAASDERKCLVIEASGGDEEFWRDYFDLDTDYGAYKKEICKCESRIKVATEEGYGIRILHQDFFEMLISFIISQNNNIPRIKKCIESISREYGELIEGWTGASGEPVYAFPRPESLAAADPGDIQALKLGYRAEYIVRSAQKYLKHGEYLDKCETSEERVEALTSYSGVGPKVANCILLFGMRDFTAFPVDVWVKRIMNDMYGFNENDTRGMQEFAAERFGELSGLAQQYLFHYYRNIRKE